MRSRDNRVLWPIDGPDHDDVSRDAIFENGDIRDFLDNDRQTILVASKGMGKTLLLRAKKKALEDANTGQIIIPRGDEYDLPEIHGDIPTYYSGFSNPEFWSELWRAAILFSTLTHGFSRLVGSSNDGRREVDYQQDLEDFLARLPFDGKFQEEFLRDVSRAVQFKPSHYVGEFLTHGLSVVEKLRRKAHLLSTMTSRFIHTPVCVFIDAFDQTITDHFQGQLEVWKNGQIGLMLASHKLNADNNHIKAYVSIRQEAFAGYLGQHREAIKGKSVLLDYSARDFRSMFEQAVARYSQYRTLEQFAYIDQVHNDVYGVDEEVFPYILRHTSGTARSLMYFGQQISRLELDKCPSEDVEDELKERINHISAENIITDYLKGQRAIFLRSLCDESAISLFLSMMPSNILNYDAMFAINREFERVRGIDGAHIFCELFNIGLLGTRSVEGADLDGRQFFKRPHEFEWQQAEIIKDQHAYFLHPALHGQLVNRNPKYRVNRRVIIGSGYPWAIADSKELFPRLFLSHSSLDKEFVEEAIPVLRDQMSLLFPHTVWYDKWDIKAGQDIHQEVEKGVDDSDIVLIFLSKNSLESGWVDREWRLKHLKEIELGYVSVIAVLIDDTKFSQMPKFLAAKKVHVWRAADSSQADENPRQHAELMRINASELADDIWHVLNERDEEGRT